MPIATRKDVRNNRTSVGFRDALLTGPNSECGVGALMPWAGKMWITTYPAENGNAEGCGLWSMDESGDLTLVAETNGTHAGRAIGGAGTATTYAYIGEHKIHFDGTVIPLTGFNSSVDRISAWAKVPGSSWMYALTMGGLIYRNDASTASATVEYVGDAGGPTGAGGMGGSLKHYKAAWGTPGRLYVVSNVDTPNGRLGYLDLSTVGGTPTFTRVEAAGDSYIEVAGSYDGNNDHVFATGQDGKTGFLWLIDGKDANPARRFRLPLPSHQQTKAYQQEWMRIRQADTERFLMDFHGCYYALSPFLHNVDNVNDTQPVGLPQVEPLAMHSRTTTDWAIFNGKMWLGGNQSSTQGGNYYPNGGQSQSILMGVDSTDHLLALGRKPRGRGYWIEGAATGTAESELMLARGYDRKVIYAQSSVATELSVHLYFDRTKRTWPTKLSLTSSTLGYLVLPEGVNPDWISFTAATSAVASVWMDVS